MDFNKSARNQDRANKSHSRREPILLEYTNGLFQGLLNDTDKRQGKGVYYWDSGEIYYGEWNFDDMHGEGILYFALGGYVYGTFERGKVNGYCVLTFPNSDYIAGFWQNGSLHGKAVRYYNQQNAWNLNDYEKGFLKRKLHSGTGVPPLYNFDMVEAHYLKKLMAKDVDLFASVGNKEAQPMDYVSISEDSWYHGNVIEGMPHGLGILCYRERKNIRGFFKMGEIDGPGRTLFSNGDVFDGFYKKGKFHGLGMYYNSDTDQYLYGVFEENECNQVLSKGEGFPLDLVKSIKRNYHIATVDYVRQITDVNVLTLTADDQYLLLTKTDEPQESGNEYLSEKQRLINAKNRAQEPLEQKVMAYHEEYTYGPRSVTHRQSPDRPIKDYESPVFFQSPARERSHLESTNRQSEGNIGDVLKDKFKKLSNNTFTQSPARPKRFEVDEPAFNRDAIHQPEPAIFQSKELSHSPHRILTSQQLPAGVSPLSERLLSPSIIGQSSTLPRIQSYIHEEDTSNIVFINNEKTNQRVNKFEIPIEDTPAVAQSTVIKLQPLEERRVSPQNANLGYVKPALLSQTKIQHHQGPPDFSLHYRTGDENIHDESYLYNYQSEAHNEEKRNKEIKSVEARTTFSETQRTEAQEQKVAKSKEILVQEYQDMFQRSVNADYIRAINFDGSPHQQMLGKNKADPKPELGQDSFDMKAGLHFQNITHFSQPVVPKSPLQDEDYKIVHVVQVEKPNSKPLRSNRERNTSLADSMLSKNILNPKGKSEKVTVKELVPEYYPELMQSSSLRISRLPEYNPEAESNFFSSFTVYSKDNKLHSEYGHHKQRVYHKENYPRFKPEMQTNKPYFVEFVEVGFANAYRDNLRKATGSQSYSPYSMPTQQAQYDNYDTPDSEMRTLDNRKPAVKRLMESGEIVIGARDRRRNFSVYDPMLNDYFNKKYDGPRYNYGGGGEYSPSRRFRSNDKRFSISAARNDPHQYLDQGSPGKRYGGGRSYSRNFRKSRSPFRDAYNHEFEDYNLASTNKIDEEYQQARAYNRGIITGTIDKRWSNYSPSKTLKHSGISHRSPVRGEYMDTYIDKRTYGDDPLPSYRGHGYQRTYDPYSYDRHYY